MKKLLILLGLSLLVSLGSYAQKNKRTSAYMYNKNQQYAKAKEAIDEAVKHPKTAEDSKTWLYRGEIYYNIAESGAAVLLAPNALNISYESLMKAKEFDTKDSYKDEINRMLGNLSILIFNKAHAAYKDGEYEASLIDYETGFKIAESMGNFDTVTAFYIGMIGMEANNPQLSADYLAKCVEKQYNNPQVYIYYSRAEKQLGDTTKAYEILEKGREVFPNESSIQLEEAQLYMETGNNAKLREAMIVAIKADDTQSNLYVILGQTYDSDGDYENAIYNYQKAIDLGNESANVYYNIGAIYSNKGKVFLDEAKNLPLDEAKKYSELVEKGNTELEKAMPYFEKSLEINPDDNYTVLALKTIYIQLRLNDKLKGLSE